MTKQLKLFTKKLASNNRLAKMERFTPSAITECSVNHTIGEFKNMQVSVISFGQNQDVRKAKGLSIYKFCPLHNTNTY